MAPVGVLVLLSTQKEGVLVLLSTREGTAFQEFLGIASICCSKTFTCSMTCSAQETFGKAGLVSKLVLPETKTVAIVEYQRPGDARQAFRSLAYKRFQTAPMYIEWAPKDVFTGVTRKASHLVCQAVKLPLRVVPKGVVCSCLNSSTKAKPREEA